MTIRPRLQAACIHFLSTLPVVLAAAGIVAFLWYPAPLLEATGGVKILWILLAVDMVLGPILTFLVYDTGKKSLRRDIATIVFIQLLALGYGLHTFHKGRPVYIAFVDGYFHLAQASDISSADIVAAGKPLPQAGPIWTGTRQATDKNVHEDILFSQLAGLSYAHFPQYHSPLESNRAQILAHATAISTLKKHNSDNASNIDIWLEKHGRTASNTAYLALKAKARNMVVMVDAQNGQVIGIAPFAP